LTLALALGLALGPWAGVARGDDLAVRVELTPLTIGVEQAATLTIVVTGGGARRLQPVPDFELDNLRVVAGPYSEERFEFSNGRTSRRATLSWRVEPLEVGPAGVHSLVVAVGGQTFELADLAITVQQDPVDIAEPPISSDPFDRLFEPFLEPRRRSSQPRGEVFLRAVATPEQAWVGQQILYRLDLYTQSDISSINPEKLPDFQGFWVREVPQPKRYEPEMVEVEGKTFARVTLLERALFPLRPGSFELEATRALMAVRVPSTTMRMSLLSHTEEVQRVSNSVRVTVKPLPEPPAGFSGAVGDLEIASTLEPSTVEAGGATTLRVELHGKGLLQGLPDPELPELPGFQVYPPQESSSEDVRQGDVYGSRSWSYVLIPERPGPVEIPQLELPYFDPAQTRYLVARSEPLRLDVVPATRGLAASSGEGRLHPIRNAALPVAGSTAPWLAWLPHVLMASALLGLLTTWATRRTGRFTPEHRRALHGFEDRLDEIERMEHGRHVASALESAWRDFLRDRWEIEAGSPSSRWSRELGARGASTEAGGALEKLAEDIHYLRYAPQLSSTEALQGELVERSRQILRSLH
jgi:hypothetical protein